MTAVAAERTADGWTVAVATGRIVRLWRLDDSLAVVTYEDIPLGGDAGQPARALSLVSDPAVGILRLSVADGLRLVRHEVPADVSVMGNPVPDIWADRGFCGIDTKILRDGSFWMAGDLSDELRVWESERGVEPCVRLSANPSCLALGELYDGEDDASMPMLAWAERGSVYVKDCSVDENGESMHPRERLPGDFPDVTSLVFAGPVERPVLLLCTAQTVSRAWDLWSRTWLGGPGIPARGYTVYAVRTATDPEGLVMALQGENRCDLIRLSHTFFGTGARRE